MHTAWEARGPSRELCGAVSQTPQCVSCVPLFWGARRDAAGSAFGAGGQSLQAQPLILEEPSLQGFKPVGTSPRFIRSS